MQLESAFKETEKRRILQTLWNRLDEIVEPHLDGGLVLCVSGGADSRALLETVARWPLRLHKTIWVVCVDHQTRPETFQEAKAVVARAKVLGFKSQVLSFGPAQKFDEASLRQRRYEALWKFAHTKNLKALVMAHHQDDEAEGFLMNLFGLGGGREGSGMKSVSAGEAGVVLRPFLDISRRYLVQVLTLLDSVDYFLDPSNEKGHGKRVKVRQWIEREGISFHLEPGLRLAEIAQRRTWELEALDKVALAHVEHHLEKNEISIAVSSLMDEGLILRALVLGIGSLGLNRDVRGASKVLKQVIKKVKALDPKRDSIKVGAHSLIQFDLPGLRLSLEKDFSGQDVLFLRKESL